MVCRLRAEEDALLVNIGQTKDQMNAIIGEVWSSNCCCLWSYRIFWLVNKNFIHKKKHIKIALWRTKSTFKKKKKKDSTCVQYVNFWWKNEQVNTS